LDVLDAIRRLPPQSVVAPSGELSRGKDAGLVESNGSLMLGDDLKSPVG